MSDDPLIQEYGDRRALRVRIHLGERNHHAGQPLYTAIVHAGRRTGIGGATVIKGIEGFGAIRLSTRRVSSICHRIFPS